jgi:hypothetical protein
MKSSFLVFVLIALSIIPEVVLGKEDCKGYSIPTKEHLKKVSSGIKNICRNEVECKDHLGFNQTGPWQSCLSIEETIVLQDYTQTYGSLKRPDLLEAIFKRLPLKSVKVYRGSSPLRDSKGNIVKLAVGNVYELPRYVSTSLSQAVAEERFANGVVLIINAKSARDIRKYSTISDEEEHILLSGTKLRINRIYSKVLPPLEVEGQIQPAMKVTVYEMTEV